MKSTGITSKNFGRKLSGVIKSAKSQRDALQNLILFGLEHYKGHNDTVYLTKCMSACVGVQSLPTGKMKAFIQAHANVSWKEIQNKAGKAEAVFKMNGKAALVTEPAEYWYDYSTIGDAKPDLDVDMRIINLAKSIDKAAKDGKLKNPKHAKEVRAELDNLANKVGIQLKATA